MSVCVLECMHALCIHILLLKKQQNFKVRKKKKEKLMSIIVLSGCVSPTKKLIPAWESEKSIRAHQTKKKKKDRMIECV